MIAFSKGHRIHNLIAKYLGGLNTTSDRNKLWQWIAYLSSDGFTTHRSAIMNYIHENVLSQFTLSEINHGGLDGSFLPRHIINKKPIKNHHYLHSHILLLHSTLVIYHYSLVNSASVSCNFRRPFGILSSHVHTNKSQIKFHFHLGVSLEFVSMCGRCQSPPSTLETFNKKMIGRTILFGSMNPLLNPSNFYFDEGKPILQGVFSWPLIMFKASQQITLSKFINLSLRKNNGIPLLGTILCVRSKWNCPAADAIFIVFVWYLIGMGGYLW